MAGVLELQAAMEILAEVFNIRPSEVEEMIRLRSEDREMWLIFKESGN
jgi:hypothetical protein